jgi:transposase-like protein
VIDGNNGHVIMFHKEESDYVTGVYRCKDCIKNFKIRYNSCFDKLFIMPSTWCNVGMSVRRDIETI